MTLLRRLVRQVDALAPQCYGVVLYSGPGGRIERRNANSARENRSSVAKR